MQELLERETTEVAEPPKKYRHACKPTDRMLNNLTEVPIVALCGAVLRVVALFTDPTIPLCPTCVTLYKLNKQMKEGQQ